MPRQQSGIPFIQPKESMARQYTIHTGSHTFTGQFYPTAGFRDPDLNPGYCFVPDECISNGKLNRTRYLDLWASLNCTVQPFPIGSHALPEMDSPPAEPPEYLLRLYQKRLSRCYHSPIS